MHFKHEGVDGLKEGEKKIIDHSKDAVIVSRIGNLEFKEKSITRDKEEDLIRI